MRDGSVGFRGRIVEVGIEEVRLPNGRCLELEVVRHPGGAAVVALDDYGRVCLLRQYRHVAGGWLWELPAGKRDGGEPPLEAARREAAEEAGVGAELWDELGAVISSPGVFTEVVHLFLARRLSYKEATPEDHELLEVHWIPLALALQWAKEGTIQDAKTLIGLFRAAAFLDEKTPPSAAKGESVPTAGTSS